MTRLPEDRETVRTQPRRTGSGAASRQLLLDTLSGFTTPSTQTVYPSLAAVTTACGRTPTEWYAGNLALGNWTGYGATALTKGAGTFRFQQLWPGWNGTDMTSLQAVEFLGTDSTAQAFDGGTSLYNLSQSLCFVFNARLLRATGAARGIIGKKGGSTSATAGYTFQTNAGVPSAIIADGTTQATVNGPGIVDTLDGFANGAPQWIALKMDLTSGNATIFAYRTAGTPVAMPSGTKTNATSLYVGGQPFLFSAELLQILQWGVFTGAEAEAFTIDDLNELDNVCRVPTPLTGHVRYHCVAPVVGTNAGGLVVGHCAGSTVTTAKNDFAHGYKSNATLSTQKLGVLCERGVQNSSDTAATNLQKRNRLLWSDNLNNAAWTKTNATTAANAGNDPGGYFGAASLTASADNGIATQNFTAEIDEVHTVSIFVKRNGGSDVSGRLSLNNSADSAELGGANFTATSTWTRVVVEVDNAAVTVTTGQIRIKLNTNGTSIFATYAQAEYGSVSEYMPQIGVLKNKDDIEHYVSNADGSVYNPRGGRIECTVIGHAAEVPSTGAFIFSTDCGTDGSTFEDRHFIQRDALDSTYEREVRIYDSAADAVSLLSDITDATSTDEVAYVSEWEAHRPLPGYTVRAIAEVNGTVCTTGDTTATAAWQVGTGADRLFVGMRHSMSAHLEGIVERLRVWGRL